MEIKLETLPELLRSVTLASLLPALIYLVAGLIIVKMVMRAVARVLERSSVDKTLHKFILTLAKLVLYFVLFMTVAGALGIQITSFVALLSVAGLAVSLSLQGLLSNLASGVILLSVRPFKVGDYIVVGDKDGVVSEIAFMYTKITTFDKRVIYIPNSQISSSTIENFNDESKRRVDLTFNVAYDCRPADVKAAISEAVAQVPKTLADPKPFVRLSAYKECCVEYTMRVWCMTEDYWDVYFDALEMIPQNFAKHGVEFTYPHLYVHPAAPEKAAKSLAGEA